MADNVAITAGSGTTIAADEVVDATLGTVKVQFVKIMDGTLDGSTKAAVSSAGLKVDLSGTAANSTAVKVDGSAVTQPVSLASVPSHAVTNAGTFAVQESGSALTALQLIDDNMVAQGTALGTTKNALVGGSVTTSAPTYTTGQISPLSLDTTGALRVNVTSGGGTGGTSSTVGSAAPSTATAVGFTDGTNMVLAKVKGASTGAAAATDPALVVTIRDANSNGSATSANSAPVVVASDQAPVAVKGNTVVQAASSTITRPADTTAYASGDLVANSTTAGSVSNLQFTTLARVSGGSGVIVGAQIQKSSTGVTNAAFRLHLFSAAPTYTSAGDNSAISSVVVASGKGYLGYVDITAMVAFSDVAWGSGAPDNSRGSIPYVATAQTIYGLLEARGAYTPTSGEVFTVSLDALQD